MKKLAACLTVLQLLFVAHSAVAGGGNGLPEIMAHFAKVEKSEVAYREVKHVAIVQKPLVSNGVLSYISPDTLIQEVDHPQSARYEIRGDQVVAYKDGVKSESFSLSRVPALRAFIESFRAVLSGNIKQLNEYYEVWFSGSEQEWQLRLLPRNEQMKELVDRIVIKGDGTDVKTISIYEVGGDWSEMKLTPMSGKNGREG